MHFPWYMKGDFMENNKFNGFMFFIAFVITLSLVVLDVEFWVSFVFSLMCVLVIRACWVVYSILWRIAERVDYSAIKEKRGKKFKG